MKRAIQAILILAIWTAHPANIITAQDAQWEAKLTLRLRSPHSGFVDGKSLRLAIEDVAGSSPSDSETVNIWLDRKVNPGQPVSPGALGPTCYASLVSIAQSAGCVCYPIDHCVVIGRPEWVAHLAQDFISRTPNLASPSRTRRRINVSWPALSTPREAMDRILQTTNPRSPSPVKLPHDLWAANKWNNIDARAAAHLVEGQFQKVEPSLLNESRFQQRYPMVVNTSLRKELQKLDADASFRSVGRPSKEASTQVDASAKAHFWLCAQLLGSPQGKAAGTEAFRPGTLASLDADQRTFSLTVRNERAGDVLVKLLGTARVRCSFEGGANLLADSLVSFSATDKRLGQLVRMAAKEAGLQLKAGKNGVEFRPEN